jgi:hypothetical protein
MLPTIGTLLDRSFSLYERHWRTLVRLGSWVFLIVFINFLIWTVYPIDVGRLTRDLTGWEMLSVALHLLNNVVGGIVIGTWTLNMVISAIHRAAKQQTIETATIARESWKGLLPQIRTFLASLLVFGLATAIPTALIFGCIDYVAPHIPLLLGQLLVFLLLLGYLPAIAVLFLTVFASIACVVDGVSGFAALRKSMERIRPQASAMLPRILLPKLLYLAVLLLMQYLLLQLSSLFIDTTVGDTLLNSRLHQMSNLLTYAVPFLFLNPLMLITDYLLYQTSEQ